MKHQLNLKSDHDATAIDFGLCRATAWSVIHALSLALMVGLSALPFSALAGPTTVVIQPAIITLDAQLAPIGVASSLLTPAERMSQAQASAFSDRWLDDDISISGCNYTGSHNYFPASPLTGSASPVSGSPYISVSGLDATVKIPVSYYQAGGFPYPSCGAFLYQFPGPRGYYINASVLMASGRKSYLFDQLPSVGSGIDPDPVFAWPALNNRQMIEQPGVMHIRLLCPESGTPLRNDLSAAQVSAVLTSGPQSGKTQAQMFGLASGVTSLNDLLFVRDGATYDVNILYTANSDEYLNKFTWGCTASGISFLSNIGGQVSVDCTSLPCGGSGPGDFCSDGVTPYYFGHIKGTVSMTGALTVLGTLPQHTRLVADGGLFGNYRYGPAAPNSFSFASGAFLIRNIMALDPNGQTSLGENYRVYANMSFSIYDISTAPVLQTEEFTSPCTSAHVMPCETNDIGSVLDMTAGYVTGDIMLQGITDVVNCPCLTLLDIPASRVAATGPCDVSGADVTFGGSFTAGTFTSNYRMALAGLNPSASSVWNPNILDLYSSSISPVVNSHVKIVNNFFANQTIVPGATIPNVNHHYCFSSVEFLFVNSNPARPFSNPGIVGSGGFNAAADFQGNPANYGVSINASGTSTTGPGYNQGSVLVCIPAGTYTVTPSISYLEGVATVPDITFTVGCNQKIVIPVFPLVDTNCCADCTTNSYISYNVVVQPGFNFLANTLCRGTNTTLNLLLPNAPDGAEVYKWDPQTQDFDPNIAIYSAGGSGWSPNLTIALGEGFAFYNSGGVYTNTFRGCLPDCPLPCLPGTNGCVLVGRHGLGTATWTNLSSCPPICGTEVRIWNPATQGFSFYDYINGVWQPSAPVLGVGQSAFVCLLVDGNSCALICSTNKTVQCGTNWSFDPPVVPALCGGTNVHPVILTTETNALPTCTQAITRTWLYVDGCGNSNVCSQTVTVVDTTPPNIFCPTNLVVADAGAGGATVNYNVTATDICSTNVVVVCTPPSGTFFPCGTNVVNCTATDACGKTNTCSFQVIVVCSCLGVANEHLSCVTNAAGQFTYSFSLKNNTGVPVKYLYLVAATNCFSFSPDITTFKPPLLPGQTTNVSVTINRSGVCASNLCFIISAHDSNFVECCSISHCLDATVGPRLVSVTPACGTNKITVTFSAALDPATMLSVPNFIVDDMTHHVSLTYSSTTFGADLKTVCLYTVAPLSPGTQYQLTVNNVKDACGNTIATNSQMSFCCPYPDHRLLWTYTNGQLCLSWVCDGVLECTSSLNPPILWSPAPSQANPQCFAPGSGQKFFRLRQ